MQEIPFTGLARDLLERCERQGSIRIGIIGAGEMGTDLLTQCRFIRGMRIAAISSRSPQNINHAVSIAYGQDTKVQEANTQSALTKAIESNQIALTFNELLVTNPLIDVVIDATGKPEVAAHFSMMAMENGKHVVTMNAEADATIGTYLKHQADRLGVIYTLGAGDEPSGCMELIEFATTLGFKIICAGKGKNNPLNHHACPDDYREEALRRNMNPRMLVEFVDGSKTMIEMAILANATGFLPDIPGMHGPQTNRKDIDKIFIPQEDGGILSKKGVVDYTIGKDVAPGVFVVVEAQHPRIIERMNDLHIGCGPYYSFFRPYHLTSLEVPLTVARVMLYKKADMTPLFRPIAEVCARAKRDLEPGETLDAMGGNSYRAWTMTVCDARSLKALPVGLLEGAKIIKPIKKDMLITACNIKLDTSTRLYNIRILQEKMLYNSKDTFFSCFEKGNCS